MHSVALIFFSACGFCFQSLCVMFLHEVCVGKRVITAVLCVLLPGDCSRFVATFSLHCSSCVYGNIFLDSGCWHSRLSPLFRCVKILGQRSLSSAPFLYFSIFCTPAPHPQPRKQGSHCSGCAVEDNRWIHPKRRGEEKGKHKVKSVCECEFSPINKPAVYSHSLPCEWQVE